MFARAGRRALTLAFVLGAPSALAQAPPPTQPQAQHPLRPKISPYEQRSIDEGVSKLGASIDPNPDGKIIEAIDVITLDVFEPRDPLPRFLTPIANWFHATTRKYVIEREVLLGVGQRWDQALVDETARNLRGLPQLSLVLTVPLAGSAPDRVRLLVITKDVWSLRLNNGFTFADGRLQYLLLQPTEENLIGSHQQVLATLVMDPATLSLGGGYVIPRLDGSRVRATVSANAVLNRYSGTAEGSNGSFTFGQPLYSTLAEWAWGGSMTWNHQIVRQFIGGEYTSFDPKSGSCLATGALHDTPSTCRYTADQLGGSYVVTRSWGSTLKHDVNLGVAASRNVYDIFPTPFTGANLAAFKAALVPVSDTKIGPYLEYHDYSTRFMDVLDFETLALTENYRRGHEVFIHVAPFSSSFLSTRSFVNILASAAYTVPLGDGLVRGIVQADTEISTEKTPPAGQGRIPDGNVEAAIRIMTPRFPAGRFVFDAHVLDRYANYLNALTSLGGDTRLRGYPTADFVGASIVSSNVEFRSRPVELLSVDFGGVLFYDTGDAFNDFHKIFLKQSVGFGARVEFPQLERTVLRVDWGFPLTRGGPFAGTGQPSLPSSPWPGDIVVTFGQAFSVPTIPTGN